ncbi:hypothetical protein [Veillonella magna]|uniref:hypothetical protein n=1 Tax=Veillonella magna TaxID=464322 RepID=UPI0023F3338C|nr:hypothetical protein [Veillonella magna]
MEYHSNQGGFSKGTQYSNTSTNVGTYGFTLMLPVSFSFPIFCIAKDRGDGGVAVSSNISSNTVNAYADRNALFWDYIAIGIVY